MAESPGLENIAEVRTRRKSFAGGRSRRGHSRDGRVVSIGREKPPGRLGSDSASHNALRIAKTIPADGRPVPASRPVVGAYHLRFRARTPAANDQPRSFASIDHAALPGMDRILRLGNANGRPCRSRFTNGTARQGL